MRRRGRGRSILWVYVVLGFLLGFSLGSALFLHVARAGAQSPEVAAALEHAAAEYGVAPDCLRRLAWRESRYLPWITNATGHRGLFQFSDRTWAFMSRAAGYRGASPYDAWASAHVAAWAIAFPMFSQGGLRHWGGTC